MAKSDEVQKRRLQPNISSLDVLASMDTDSIRPTKSIKWKDEPFEPYFEPKNQPDPEMDSMMRNFKRGVMMKRNMLNRKLRRAKAKCPHVGCDGYWFGMLAGPKNHLHVHCTGSCGFRMME